MIAEKSDRKQNLFVVLFISITVYSLIQFIFNVYNQYITLYFKMDPSIHTDMFYSYIHIVEICVFGNRLDKACFWTLQCQRFLKSRKCKKKRTFLLQWCKTNSWSWLINPSPLDEYPGLHGVHDAAESRLLLRASQHQPHLTREGGGEPITHLWRHRVRLYIAELILRVHQPPEEKKQTEVKNPFPCTNSVSNAL